MADGFIPQTPAPLPVTKTIIGPDGRIQQVQVDPQTGQQIGPAPAGSGYDAITSGAGGGYGYWDPFEKNHEPEKTTAEEVIEKPAEERVRSERGSDPRDAVPGSQMSGPTNNFGYFDKPGWMGYMSNLPGIPGMMGKAVNLGANANNLSAMNKARDLMDLPDKGFMGQVGQLAKDQKGQVANVNIGNNQYTVGFEAQAPTGQTNLTPNEARQRAGWMNTQVTETPKQEAKMNAAQFQENFPDENKGFVQGAYDKVKSTARDFIDSLFGGPSTDRFPDRPDPYSGGTSPTSSSTDFSPSDFDSWGSGGRGRGSEAEANRGDRGVSSGGGGLW